MASGHDNQTAASEVAQLQNGMREQGRCPECGWRTGSNANTARPYQGDMQTCDGLFEFDLSQTIVSDPWPAMVSFEFAYGTQVIGGTLTVEDARELSSLIGAAASAAEFANRKAEARRGC